MAILQDLRFAARLLLKDRFVSLMAVLALGLGLGATSTVFTCVNAVLLRGLPYPHADRLLHIDTRHAETSQSDGISYPDFLEVRAQTRAFESLAAFEDGTMNVSDEGHAPERLSGVWMSANAFDTLGQPPVIGRGFAVGEDEPGAEPVVILGHAVWTDRYGADPAVLGRTIKINEAPATIIGVMPKGMRFPMESDLWQPLVPDGKRAKRTARYLSVLGRIREGTTVSEARAEVATVFGRLAQQYPESNKGLEAVVMPYNDRFNGGPIKLVFLALMAAVGFVLLIACANVANLMLARSTRRAREIAVRVSLGATRGGIVRQLLVESLLLATIAGALGLALSSLGVRLFDQAVANTGKPYWILFTIDHTVLAFLAVVCLGTTILFGLAPALHVSRTDVHETLKQGGRGGTTGRRARRFTTGLVVAQLALTVVLLTGAGLMIRSFLTLYRMDLGIRTERVLTMRMTLADRKYPTPADWLAFHDRLAERVGSVPGVRSASLASALPARGGGSLGLQIEGEDALPPVARIPR